MRIFVTGATGYIGNAVATALRRNGHHVQGLVRTEAKALLLARDEIEPVLGDLSDPDGFRDQAASADVVVHCAADRIRYAELEKRNIERLLSYALDQTRARTVIYTTGVWLCGNTDGRIVDERSETEPLGLVKWRLELERLVLGAASSLLRTFVIRPGCVYGKSGGLTGMWFRGAFEHEQIDIAGKGNNAWSMVHVDDLADLYVRVAESRLKSELFFATDSLPHYVLQLVMAISMLNESKVHSLSATLAHQKFGPLAEGLMVHQHVSSAKASALLGWFPRAPGFLQDVRRYWLAWQASRGQTSSG